MHRQQKLSQVSWKNLYKLPTSADRLVIEFRKWFDTYCSGKLPWEEVGIIDQQPLQINHNREQMLDRYHQHTQHCHSCRTTLNSIQKIQKILFAYFVLTLSITALLPDPYRLKLGIPIIVTGLLGLAGYSWLKLWLEPQFYFVDYIHAEK